MNPSNTTNDGKEDSMAGPPDNSNGAAGNNTGAQRLDRGSTPSTPRWVKLFGMVTVILLVLFVVLHLTGVVGMAGHH